MDPFPHKKLPVYRKALDLAVGVQPIAKELRDTQPSLAHRLQRASVLVVTNTAKGGSEPSTRPKLRFFCRARQAALEVAAGLEVVRITETTRLDAVGAAQRLADHIADRLTCMANLAVQKEAERRYRRRGRGE